jgi:hypothetical protein
MTEEMKLSFRLLMLLSCSLDAKASSYPSEKNG